jgi:outer membrane protein TolC
MDLASARAYAMEMRPEIQEAQLKIQQAEYDRRIKKSAYIPDVSLAFNYQTAQNIYFMPKHTASIGVFMTWEPFDWGRKKWELSEKDKSLDQARLGLRESQNQVLMEVNAKYRQLQQARSLLNIGQLARETARENLRVLSNRYSLQAALLKDVLQAQNSLAESHHQYQQALLSFWTARADFQKAIGEDNGQSVFNR